MKVSHNACHIGVSSKQVQVPVIVFNLPRLLSNTTLGLELDQEPESPNFSSDSTQKRQTLAPQACITHLRYCFFFVFFYVVTVVHTFGSLKLHNTSRIDLDLSMREGRNEKSGPLGIKNICFVFYFQDCPSLPVVIDCSRMADTDFTGARGFKDLIVDFNSR